MRLWRTKGGCVVARETGQSWSHAESGFEVGGRGSVGCVRDAIRGGTASAGQGNEGILE